MQVLGLLPAFNPLWPSFVTSYIRVLSLASLDISAVFEPLCTLKGSSSTTFVRIWAVKMAMPLLLSTAFALAAAGVRFYAALVPLIPRRMCHVRSMPRERVRRMHLVLINAAIMCLSVVYVNVISVAISPMRCERNSVTGRRYVQVEPTIGCSSRLYRTMLGIGMVQILAFGLAFPLVLLGLLFARQHALFWRDSYSLALGMLYKKYSFRFFYLEPISLLRKGAFVLGLAIFSRSGAGPLAWALCVTLVWLVATLVLRPFRDFAVTRLESVAQCSTAFVLALGLIYQASERTLASRTARGLGALIVLVISLTIAAIVLGIALAIYRSVSALLGPVRSATAARNRLRCPMVRPRAATSASESMRRASPVTVWSRRVAQRPFRASVSIRSRSTA